MNLQKASEKAKYLFISTGIPHVVTEVNGTYSVHTEKEWKGETVKKYSHAENRDIPELRTIASEDILSDTGNERPKPVDKKRQTKK